MQNLYLHFWLKKQTYSTQNEHATIVCASNQSDSWNAGNTSHVVPHIWKVDDHCSKLGKQIPFEHVKSFKVEKGSPKLKFHKKVIVGIIIEILLNGKESMLACKSFDQARYITRIKEL